MHIKKIQKVSETGSRKFGPKCGAANEAEDFHHVTESERQKAQDLWNKYNDDLEAMGLQLMYDYGNGDFYVCSTDLVREGDGKRNLTDEELATVTAEGEFDRNAKNNPPWFTGGDYTLAIK